MREKPKVVLKAPKVDMGCQKRTWGGQECEYKATWEREFNLPWREAGDPKHLDDKVDSDQLVINKENSLSLDVG